MGTNENFMAPHLHHKFLVASRIFLGFCKRKRDASKKSGFRLSANGDPKWVLGLSVGRVNV